MNDQNLLEDQPIAWTPTPDVIECSRLTKFMQQVGVSTWDDLYAYSINDVEKFTEEVIKFLDIKFDPPYEKLLDTSNGVEMPTWLAGAGLNVTEMCLDRWQTDEMNDQPAVIWEGEDGAEATISYAQLLSEVSKCSEGLRARGLGKGDAVGIHMPMIPETVIALLAINRIGGIAVPVFSGYGVEAIVSRMNAVGAKALLTCPNFVRRGKQAMLTPVGLEAAGKCPTINYVFLVPAPMKPPPRPLKPGELPEEARKLIEAYKAMSDEEKVEYQRTQKAESERQREEFFVQLKELGTSETKIDEIRQQMETRPSGIGSISFGIYDVHKGPIERQYRINHWQQLFDTAEAATAESSVEQTAAEDPLIILYTSGTTGKPKGIAHTHASFPIKAAQDMAFGTDVGKGTRISWYTDIGWMMGPWLIYGALINGATICIYDGAPDYPQPDRMWEFCAKHKVEVLGISPTLVRSLATHGDDLPKKHDLSSLRAFASTGEPWNPAPWWWLFEKVGNSKLPIINYSGGTEIAGGILMGNPLLPIKPCSFPAPCPGMDVDILDEDGQPVDAGKVGELVIKQPWIGMARGFWQEKERYLDTYWRRFKDIWVHGDFAMRDKDGHWFILGRSDDTLKVAGKRVGPAEVESLLVAHPQVTEAAVIGVPDEVKGTAMVAFVVTSDKGQGASEEVSSDSSLITYHSSLEQELKTLVAKDMGKPLAPSRIHFVTALPKTRNAKVMRRVIRSAYLGEDPGDLSALEHPETVVAIRSSNPEL
ncbi:MAG: AMP-binding protein [Pyrinomonadaceae bacterium]|nr:AMP-binding protein [Pyrinomonadaceae bacterium]